MLLKDAIYDYDYQLNVEEDFIVCKKNNFNVSHYLHGKCHLFALALHEATGLKIGLFVDEDGTIIKDCMKTNRLDPYENEFEKNSIKLYVQEFINLNLHIYIPD